MWIHERVIRNDEALIYACRQGDTSAWNILVRRYQGLIYSIPRHAGLTEDQSAHVFQRVFARLAANLRQIEPSAPVNVWLTTVARTETWRVIRQGNEHWSCDATEHGLEDDLTVPEDAPPLMSVIKILERQHALRQAVDTLDECCRIRMLTLLYGGRMSRIAIMELLDSESQDGEPSWRECFQQLHKALERM
jgi:RNA polymerase sigma-70 factor (ECF subfamily)